MESPEDSPPLREVDFSTFQGGGEFSFWEFLAVAVVVMLQVLWRRKMEKRARKRLFSGLKQHERHCGPGYRSVEEACVLTEALTKLCGVYSLGAQNLLRIGKEFLAKKRPDVLVPVCPDYAHDMGRYTFDGLGDQIPLLATQHIRFLEACSERGVGLTARFLIADQEGDDPALCRKVQKTPESFEASVVSSTRLLKERIATHEWQAFRMSEYIPDIRERERYFATQLRHDCSLSSRIQSDTSARSGLYRKISASLSWEECTLRTIRTAAQYACFGEFAAQHGALVLNHSTVNLVWYLESGCGLLHNPITVY